MSNRLTVVFFHSSIFFFDTKAFAKASWSNLKSLKPSLILTTVIATIVLGLLNLIIITFRLLDELLFFGYRKTKIVKPVFIISNPRSGTTHLHRLMTLDEDRFAYFLLYHTIGNSILYYKIIKGITWMDRRVGHPFRRFFNWTEKTFFTGWKDIHPMGWKESEEDEAIFTFSFASPAVGLLYPYIKSFEEVEFPDDYPKKKGKKLMRFYKNSLQRFMYSEGRGKTFITKNVLSTGRLKLILACFPDARIIYPARHPFQAIPSFISMFTKTWPMINNSISENSEEYRRWGVIAIKYYLYWYKISKEIPSNQFFTISYKELISDPKRVIIKIYDHFYMEAKASFLEALIEKTNKSSKYRSKHHYSLEQYGFSREETYRQLRSVFDRYDFEAN